MKPILGIALALAAAAATAAAPAVAAPPGGCPPGLAKKGSCTPPGHAKRWNRGERIDGVRIEVVRHDRLGLPRPGPGEYYGEVGGRIYLLAEATQRVIEAIGLIGAATD